MRPFFWFPKLLAVLILAACTSPSEATNPAEPDSPPAPEPAASVAAFCPSLGAVRAPVPQHLLRDAQGHYRYYEGRSFYVDGIHLGIDLEAPEGTRIVAGVEGTVVYYGPASGYGTRVMVIEAHSEAACRWTNGVGDSLDVHAMVFLYGHIRHTVHFGGGGHEVTLRPGDSVGPSTVIGYAERASHNGDGDEHLHFGIRLQSWAEAERLQNTTGRSAIAGYDRDGTLVAVYANPEQLLDVIE